MRAIRSIELNHFLPFQELGSQPLPTIVTEDADNSGHVSQGHRPRAGELVIGNRVCGHYIFLSSGARERYSRFTWDLFRIITIRLSNGKEVLSDTRQSSLHKRAAIITLSVA